MEIVEWVGVAELLAFFGVSRMKCILMVQRCFVTFPSW